MVATLAGIAAVTVAVVRCAAVVRRRIPLRGRRRQWEPVLVARRDPELHFRRHDGVVVAQVAVLPNLEDH